MAAYRRIHHNAVVHIFAHALAYELSKRKRSRIDKLGSNTERTGGFEQFVQVSGLCNQ